jgi:hypothetical protein
VGYDMYIEERKSLTKGKEYFRLNISGMSLFRGIMNRLGMVDWGAEASALGTDVNFSDKGISGYKLCSNDGWLVTPEELHNALSVYQSRAADRAEVMHQTFQLEFYTPEDSKWLSGYWRQWIAFLKRAEKHGGFRVY